MLDNNYRIEIHTVNSSLYLNSKGPLKSVGLISSTSNREFELWRVGFLLNEVSVGEASSTFR